MPKHSLRRLMLSKRRALSPLEVEAHSLRIQQSFMGSSEFLRAESLALYAPIHHEVDTVALQRRSFFLGKKVLYPVVDGNKLTFRQIHAASDLENGAFGIEEPGEKNIIHLPETIDIFVIPGVAFDINGRRIGYGKGFYDRTLHLLEGCGKFVGLCYDFQLVDEIVGEPHDVTMDLIFSETRIIRP
ncbi:5-formyltetrahydrofolate cyclo-ligase [Geotalea daltonii FRC-32]|uniref:5-formyltetrahydrofolate cyclo-ligase n=2 Tax=Geotalea TaxID=2910589 RepID=B9M6E4_GEODF|nr:5-formyltetrahydrofolate cyclo-ligase [Geotalea daltonii FRC-32]